MSERKRHLIKEGVCARGEAEAAACAVPVGHRVVGRPSPWGGRVGSVKAGEEGVAAREHRCGELGKGARAGSLRSAGRAGHSDPACNLAEACIGDNQHA